MCSIKSFAMEFMLPDNTLAQDLYMSTVPVTAGTITFVWMIADMARAGKLKSDTTLEDIQKYIQFERVTVPVID